MNPPSLNGKDDLKSDKQISESKVEKPEFLKESRAESIQGIISSKVYSIYI